jgi:hypothetical protein
MQVYYHQDSGTTFAPLFINNTCVGIAPSARVGTLVLTIFNCTKPASCCYCCIAAGYQVNTSCNNLDVLITACASAAVYQLLIPTKYIRYNTK